MSGESRRFAGVCRAEVCSAKADAAEEQEVRKMAKSNCDVCVNYVYDEDYECYCCLVNLDEDEMYRFLSGSQRECPYFRLDDEYGVVRKQI